MGCPQMAQAALVRARVARSRLRWVVSRLDMRAYSGVVVSVRSRWRVARLWVMRVVVVSSGVMVIIGGLVGSIVVAMYLPIFKIAMTVM